MVGYSRAVRIGKHIMVSGTTATDSTGGIVGQDDPYAQTRQILKNIEHAIVQAGGTMNDVVRTRMFVKRIEDWETIGRAHGEVFSRIRPASTLVEVKGFVHPDILVEIEADAIVSSWDEQDNDEF